MFRQNPTGADSITGGKGGGAHRANPTPVQGGYVSTIWQDHPHKSDLREGFTPTTVYIVLAWAATFIFGICAITGLVVIGTVIVEILRSLF